MVGSMPAAMPNSWASPLPNPSPQGGGAKTVPLWSPSPLWGGVGEGFALHHKQPRFDGASR